MIFGSHLQVPSRVIGARFGVDPSPVIERQGIDVTRVASDLVEQPLTIENRQLPSWIIWNHLARDRHGCLEHRNRRDIGGPVLVLLATALRVETTPQHGFPPCTLVVGY